MTIRVKICGITDPAGMDAAVEGGADWIGFVFFAASPRNIDPVRASMLSARYPRAAEGGPLRTALFVDPTDADIDSVVDRFKPDAIQMHGSLARIAEVKMKFRRQVWQSLGVSTASDLPAAADGPDALVIEGKPPKGSTRPGGNASLFDWTITRDWQAPVPWLLAGGLTPENVGEAIRASGAQAVDVSSGVERESGKKDPALIRAFISAAKSC